MPNLKDVKTQINAVGKTKQITKAMGMVATSRLRNAQMSMEGFRPYAGKFSEVLGSLSEKAGEETNPLLVPKETVKKIHIVLCTSDRGLCGGFNANLISTASKLVKEKTGEGDLEISVTNFGKRGLAWSRKKKMDIRGRHIDVVGKKNLPFSIASTVGSSFVNEFLNGVYDEVYIIYSEFVNMAKQVPVIKQLLPIPPIESDQEDSTEMEDAPYMAEHICEPPPDELLGNLLPQNVYVQIHNALLETSTSEFAARMTAMDNATTACNDMLDNLTLVYNKARQSSITADLMDIVGGAEALKG